MNSSSSSSSNNNSSSDDFLFPTISDYFDLNQTSEEIAKNISPVSVSVPVSVPVQVPVAVASSTTTTTNKKRKRHEAKTNKKTIDVAPAYALTVQNTVCGFNLGVQVDPKTAAEILDGCYFQKRFPAAIFRCHVTSTIAVNNYKPSSNLVLNNTYNNNNKKTICKGTTSVFATGQVGITGPKSKEEAFLLAHHFVENLIKKSLFSNPMYLPRVINFQVQNVVTSAALGYALNLDLFYQDNVLHSEGVSLYNPVNFSGLQYFVNGRVFVLFRTGCIVLAGGKTFEELKQLFSEKVELFQKYKLGHEYRLYDTENNRIPQSFKKKKPTINKKKKKNKKKKNTTDCL